MTKNRKTIQNLSKIDKKVFQSKIYVKIERKFGKIVEHLLKKMIKIEQKIDRELEKHPNFTKNHKKNVEKRRNLRIYIRKITKNCISLNEKNDKKNKQRLKFAKITKIS